VERKLPTLPEHLSSPPVFSGVRVSRSLVLCVRFVERYLSFCDFSFDHCVVCSSCIKCIFNMEFCDGRVDCFDKSDENTTFCNGEYN
jgi:hypothetical protein